MTVNIHVTISTLEHLIRSTWINARVMDTYIWLSKLPLIPFEGSAMCFPLADRISRTTTSTFFILQISLLKNDQWFSFVEQFVLTGEISIIICLELESISRYIWFESHSQQLRSLMYFIKSGVGRGIWGWKSRDGFQGREWLFSLWLRPSTGKEKETRRTRNRFGRPYSPPTVSFLYFKL